MSPSEIADGINSITSVEEIGQLNLLEELLKEMSPSNLSSEQYSALFGLYERFSEQDGLGLFWSILHMLEKSSRYEQYLLVSVQRKPTEFNLRMVARLIKGGFTQIGDVDLPRLLKTVSKNQAVSESASSWACEFSLQCDS